MAGPYTPPGGRHHWAARLELIAIESTEVIVPSPRTWRSKYNKSRYFPKKPLHRLDGWGDVSFLVKYRLLAANEENNNYLSPLF